MFVQVDPMTRRILGFYAEDLTYAGRQPPGERVRITLHEWQAALASGANRFEPTGYFWHDPSLGPVTCAPPTVAQRLARVGLTLDELKAALAA